VLVSAAAPSTDDVPTMGVDKVWEEVNVVLWLEVSEELELELECEVVVELTLDEELITPKAAEDLDEADEVWDALVDASDVEEKDEGLSLLEDGASVDVEGDGSEVVEGSDTEVAWEAEFAAAEAAEAAEDRIELTWV
jgi:hypothetical protein